MPQVSKRQLPNDVKERMFDVFFESIAKISNPNDVKKFFLSLLGPVEQTMLAKRLAIAVLLQKGYSYETIKDTLKVSAETIARVNLSINFEQEGYGIAVKRILRDERMQHLFERIEDKTIEILPKSTVQQIMKGSRKKYRKPKTALG